MTFEPQGSDPQRDCPAFEPVQIGQKNVSYSQTAKVKRGMKKWEMENMMSPTSDRAVQDSFENILHNF